MSHLLAYLQYELGAQSDVSGQTLADTSWSAQLQGSERVWMLLEGSHVLTLVLFAGSILFVDLRLLGLVFPNQPVSKVTDSILPYTVVAFAVMLLTGSALFFADPLEYYYNVVFRLKIAFLFAAAINIFIFHYRVQANRADWNSAARPPAKARIAAGTSVALWIAVIVTGRFMAYDWFSCDTAGGVLAAVGQCAERAATLATVELAFAQ